LSPLPQIETAQLDAEAGKVQEVAAVVQNKELV